MGLFGTSEAKGIPFVIQRCLICLGVRRSGVRTGSFPSAHIQRAKPLWGHQIGLRPASSDLLMNRICLSVFILVK